MRWGLSSTCHSTPAAAGGCSDRAVPVWQGRSGTAGRQSWRCYPPPPPEARLAGAPGTAPPLLAGRGHAASCAPHPRYRAAW
jgi:hypothetical protein